MKVTFLAGLQNFNGEKALSIGFFVALDTHSKTWELGPKLNPLLTGGVSCHIFKVYKLAWEVKILAYILCTI